MTIATALYTHLRDDAGVSAIVGTRIYPMNAPPAAVLPYVTFQVIALDDLRHMTGVVGVAETLMQLDSWGVSAGVARSLKEAIRTALHGFSGPMGDEALDVRSSTLRTARDDFERPAGGGTVGLYRVSQDFAIWHSVSVP